MVHSYSVLYAGLGDTNYDKFCAMGINLDKRMAALGGERFYPLGKADDGTGCDWRCDAFEREKRRQRSF